MLQTADSCIYMCYSNTETLATSDRNRLSAQRTPVGLTDYPSDGLSDICLFISFYSFLLTNRIFCFLMTLPQGQSFGVFQTALAILTQAGRTLNLSTCGMGLCNNAFLWEYSWSPFLPSNTLKYFLNTTVDCCSDSHQSSQLCFLDWAPSM